MLHTFNAWFGVSQHVNTGLSV